MEIIRNIKTLKAMEKKGLCKFHKDTPSFKYVYEAKSEFIYKGNKYQEKYFDGCFYPFIVKI